MSSDPTPTPPPEGQPPYVIPVRYSAPPPAPPAPPRRSNWVVLLLIALGISVGFNIVALMAFHLTESDDGSSVIEHFYSGKSSARDKIAIVKMDGVIMEGSLGFVHKQIDQAASDPAVKAIVLRISSPGGSITGSDDLYRRLIELRDGTNPQQKGGKKALIVSMGAMAASGGYYIAMPAEYIFAEVTTMTGSIGVYAAFPNVAKMGETYGFGINLIKAGAVKDSGSPFKFMTPQERQVWQDMIDQSYDRFTSVVEQGRGDKLKIKPRDNVSWTAKDIPNVDENGKPKGDKEPKTVKFVRQVADGGVWTAQDALKLGLIDKIDYLDAAIKEMANRAKLPEGSYKVVNYEKPQTLASLIFGSQATPPGNHLDAAKIAAGATPRLWYMTPQGEVAGILAAMGKD